MMLRNSPREHEVAAIGELHFIRLKQVMQRSGMSRAWTYDAIRRGEFPGPIKLGRASVWNSASVEAWVREKLEAASKEAAQ